MCVDERFCRYWLANGGLAQQGLPLNDALDEISPTDGKTYRAQCFEHARFEHHPENQAPFDVLLGREQFLRKYAQGRPAGAPTSATGEVCFEQTGRCVGGPFLDYWRQMAGWHSRVSRSPTRPRRST